MKTEYVKLLTPEIVGNLTQIHEYKGRQDFLIGKKSSELEVLQEFARLQSAEACCWAEGFSISEDRLKKLAREKTIPQNYDERRFAGYRDAYTKILEHYEYISLRPGNILQLHRDLNKYIGRDAGGQYREAENAFSGSRVSTAEVPRLLDRLCSSYTASVNEGADPLILIPLFELGFLYIYPFDNWNELMIRLLASLLLLRSGYTVEKYVCPKWPESGRSRTDDYAPFVTYFLNILTAAYREFFDRTELLTDGLSKPDRVREVIRSGSGKITKSEIMKLCPDVSQVTVQRALSELLRSGEIIKIGGGRYTSYAWNGDKVPSEREIRI